MRLPSAPPKLDAPPPPPPLSSSVLARVKALKQSGLVVSPTAPTPPASPVTIPTQSHNVLSNIDDTIKDWNNRLKKCLIDREYEKFNRVKNLIDQLYQLRKQSPTPALASSVLQITEEGNRMLASISPSVHSPAAASILHAFVTASQASGYPYSLAFSDDVRKKSSHSSHHIFFDLKACIASICGPGEQTELSFSIFNKSVNKFITENYIVKLTYNGMPTDEDRIGRLYTLFTDISRMDISSDIFLICKIVRCGRMVLPENLPADDKVHTSFRRPFGYAVLNLAPIILANDGEKEHLMKIYTSAEQNFSSLFENIIAKNGNYDTSSRAEMICVSVNVLEGDLEQILQKNYRRHNVPLTSRLGFPDVILPGDTRNSIYVNLVNGEFAQGRKTSAKNIEVAVEVRLADGQVLPQPIYVGCGVQRLDSYESIIYYHTNSPRWNERIRCDIPVSNFDRGTHLFCTFRHASTGDKGDKNEKAFEFAVIPLMKEDETVIEDEHHTFCLYKYEKKLVKEAYLALLDPIADHSKFTPTKDTFAIKTELCSTKLTQSVSLLQLLRWRKLPHNEIKNVLKSFTFIGPVEIIKYLQDIFDALFGMLQSFGTHPNELSNLVFSALIFVLNIIISDRRFTSFRSILEVYVQNHYTRGQISNVWIQLIKCMQHLASHPKDMLLAKELRSSMKAWEYLFKFIVRSFSLDDNSQLFKAEVRHLFTLTSSLFSQENAQETLIGAQILILQNLAGALTELYNTKLFRPTEILDFAKIFLTPNAGEKRIMAETKCSLATSLVVSPIADDMEARKTISLLLVECVTVYSNEGLYTLVNRLIFEFLQRFGSSVYVDHPEIVGLLPQMISMCKISGEEPDVSIRNAEAAVLVIELLQRVTEGDLAEFIKQLPDSEGFLHELFGFCNHLLGGSAVNSVQLFGVFPETWLPVLDIMQNVVLKSLAVVADIMQNSFANGRPSSTPEEFKFDMWVDLINVVVRLVCEITVVLDKPELSESTGLTDIRQKGAHLISLIWFSLRAFHLHFIPSLVGPFLELTFCQSSKELQNVALGLLVEMIEIERKSRRISSVESVHLPSRDSTVNGVRLSKRSSGGFMESAAKLSGAEIEFIEKLDYFIMAENKGDARYHQWLVSSLRTRLGSARDSAPFLHSLDRFLSLALFVKSNHGTDSDSLLSTSKLEDDDLALVLSHLMQFTSLLDRTPIYVKYIHQLADIQLRQENYAEAGWALNLHANLYDWTEEQLEAIDNGVSFAALQNILKPSSVKSKSKTEPEFLEGLLTSSALEQLHTSQLAFDRKEILTLTIIYLFYLAGHFENAMAFTETLVQEYSKVSFNYEKVSKAYKVLANLSSQLSQSQRFYPAYYRIAFIGKGWNRESSGMLNVRGKQFIYRAKEWETLGEFVERTMAKYPDAQLMKTNCWPPEQDIVDSEDQWLQICKVDAVLNSSKFPQIAEASKKIKAPDNVLGWYENNDTNIFAFTRPFKKSSAVSKDEFVNLWTENYQLKTEHGFPHFLKRSEVIEFERAETSPIENAIKNIEAKNRELEKLEKQYRPYALQKPEKKRRQSTYDLKTETKSSNVNPLTMSLNGAVDAPVNGGLPMYKKVFLSPQFTQKHPEYSDHVRKLQETIDNQVIIIGRCIELHGQIVPPEMRPLHDTIVNVFHSRF